MRLSEFSRLDEIFSPDAAATYNDKLNVISINRKLFFAGSLKDTSEMNSADIATVFHEIGHAELDVFIEEKNSSLDASIMSYFHSTLKAWYQRYFPNFSPKGLLQEHFGYYRSSLIEFFSNEINELYLNNGFNRYRGSCFLTPVLRKKLTEGITLEDFRKIFIVTQNPVFYRKVVGPDYIYLKGKDIYLKEAKIPQAPAEMIELLFWSYHQEHYGFPSNQIDLVRRMNQKHPYEKQIATCRDQLWEKWYRD